MCGICGIASSHGRADVDRVAAMSATLVHRGPDSFGEYVDGAVAIAARRLSIIDLETGDQPIANEDGTIHVVQNGELYNYRELRRDLERAGHRFRTSGDTEVLLHLYEEHGVDFAGRLRGMFAIAIWDARRRRLVLARDRFGIKPLYYRAADGELAFASELRALPRGEIDLDALEAFLAFNSIPAPLTIFRGTRKLPAGHVLVWEGGGEPQLARYARPAPVPAAATRHESEALLAEELRARLRDSVRAHLVSAPAVPGVGARRGGRQGGPVGGGGRRVVGRLLHVRRRPAGGAGRGARAARTPTRRAAAVVERARELRLQGEAVCPGRGAAAD